MMELAVFESELYVYVSQRLLFCKSVNTISSAVTERQSNVAQTVDS